MKFFKNFEQKYVKSEKNLLKFFKIRCCFRDIRFWDLPFVAFNNITTVIRTHHFLSLRQIPISVRTDLLIKNKPGTAQVGAISKAQK